MAATDMKISQSLVKSGNGVELNGVSVTYNWKNLSKKDPNVGKYDTVEVSQEGIENPVITVRGVWDIDEQTDVNTPYTNPATTLKKICQKLLIDFAALRSTESIVLTIVSGQDGTQLGGRPAAGYDNSGANTLTTTINVTVESFSPPTFQCLPLPGMTVVRLRCY